MDVVTSTILASFQAIPYATPVGVGGLFFSMFCVKKFISDQKRRNARLPPGVVFFSYFSLFFVGFFFVLSFTCKKISWGLCN